MVDTVRVMMEVMGMAPEEAVLGCQDAGIFLEMAEEVTGMVQEEMVDQDTEEEVVMEWEMVVMGGEVVLVMDMVQDKVGADMALEVAGAMVGVMAMALVVEVAVMAMVQVAVVVEEALVLLMNHLLAVAAVVMGHGY